MNVTGGVLGRGGDLEVLEKGRSCVPACHTFQENYGQKEAEKVARVKALYEELDLPGVFSRYEEDSYRRITGLIGDLSPPLPPSIFLELAHNFYKRKK